MTTTGQGTPRLSRAELLALHRRLVSIPSVSGQEGPLADFLEDWMRERGWSPQRIGQSLLVTTGQGPLLLLDSHLDTVPPALGWSRPPHAVEVVDGRVYGLGSNDAKAAVVGMLAAFDAFFGRELPFSLGLALVEQEETKGLGTEAVLTELRSRGCPPVAAVVGEPTGLDLAIAQKGLLVVEVAAQGTACHAANASAMGAHNPVRQLAFDLLALERVDLGPPHPLLGWVTLEPTVLKASSARNMVAAEATALIDLRTTPTLDHQELVRRLKRGITGELRVLSTRLEPLHTDPDSVVVRAARLARPQARTYGSATMSDLAFLKGIPAVKVGPGRTERSHTPDEYVLEAEVLEGAQFYTALVAHYADLNEASS